MNFPLAFDAEIQTVKVFTQLPVPDYRILTRYGKTAVV